MLYGCRFWYGTHRDLGKGGGDSKCLVPSVGDIKARGSLLRGSLACGNRRIIRRLTLLNSAAIAPKNCI
jgi:hypothetical protein